MVLLNSRYELVTFDSNIKSKRKQFLANEIIGLLSNVKLSVRGRRTYNDLQPYYI